MTQRSYCSTGITADVSVECAHYSVCCLEDRVWELITHPLQQAAHVGSQTESPLTQKALLVTALRDSQRA